MPDFEFTIPAEQLTKGLRPSKRLPRDSKFLVESLGAVGRDGVLASVDELTRIDTSAITDAFPFPQVFVFINRIIVCGSVKIYEWINSALVLKLTASKAKSTWTAVDFYDYIYMSNGAVAVVRNPETGVYSETTTIPTANSILNYNSQVILGAPDTTIAGASLTMPASNFAITTTQHGSWA